MTPGLWLDRYLLIDAIASGGMATVYLGCVHGTAGFSRAVAIKRMHPHLAMDPELVAMFKDEARLTARVRHPNVVAPLDFVARRGELFLVLEYFSGQSLARALQHLGARGDAVPPSVACRIAVDMLNGLHAIHSTTGEDGAPLDLVHRDVSPQNLLLCADGMSRVLDFGIAKAKGRIRETRAGIVRGKTAYMAPEHLRAEHIDRRADIYAASVVLWEALTGRMLFDDSLAPVCLPRSVRAPSELGAMVPSSLDRILLRGLAHEREQRWPTAREMALAIEGALPLPSHALVGEWLEREEGAVLSEQRRRLQEVESSPHWRGVAEGISPVWARGESPEIPSLLASSSSSSVDSMDPRAQLTGREPTPAPRAAMVSAPPPPATSSTASPTAPAPLLRAMLMAGGIYWLLFAFGAASTAMLGVVAVLARGLTDGDLELLLVLTVSTVVLGILGALHLRAEHELRRGFPLRSSSLLVPAVVNILMSTMATLLMLVMGAMPMVLLTILPLFLGIFMLHGEMRRSLPSLPSAAPTSLPAPCADASVPGAVDHRG
ncbi:serine/threonine protein kinase [Minicystis rosea]|nr:serine/threonine protein kinase [Minicystis rosea]